MIHFPDGAPYGILRSAKYRYGLPAVLCLTAYGRLFLTIHLTAMQRTSFYDLLSLVCLIIGTLFLLTGIWYALDHEWIKTTIFAISGLISYRMSRSLACCAIAASGRQK